MSPRPNYFRVFAIFVRNSLIRDLMFPANFIIESISSIGWMAMNLALYILIYQHTDTLGSAADGNAWSKYQFFVFLATWLLIYNIVQMFFVVNAEEFSELIRTGNLDFALLKPIDTQFLISFQKVDWSAASNLGLGLFLLGYALPRLDGFTASPLAIALYPIYVVMGVMIMYSIVISLAATSVWLGRNQSLYDFWFYITNFARYPMEIYQGPVGNYLRWTLTFILPVLVVVNVPARLLAKPFQPDHAYLAVFAIVATLMSVLGSRWLFQRALLSYRSASS
jgi:ABC-2 type transport system permease protein